MFVSYIVVFLLMLTVGGHSHRHSPRYQFPATFGLGVLSNCYQIDGEWNASGNGLSVGDNWSHNYSYLVADGSNADVSADSYHFYRNDVNAVKSLNVAYYSLVFGWPRIMADGTLYTLSMDGIRYYNDTINYALSQGLHVHVAMTRCELPQALQDIGGWTNPLLIDKFAVYAEVLFYFFGDRVQNWAPFLEATLLCNAFYGNGYLDPVIKSVDPVSRYHCFANTLKTHGIVYRIYHKYFYDRYKSPIVVGIHSNWYESESDDEYEVRRALAYELDYFAHPIFSETGDYSAFLIDEAKQASIRDGYEESLMPPLSDYWIDIIRGSGDVLILTWGTLCKVHTVETKLKFPRMSNFVPDTHLNYTEISDWRYGSARAMRALLKYIKNTYNNPVVYILGIGLLDDTGVINDQNRVEYLQKHFQQAALSVSVDLVKLVGLTIYSLLDQWEYYYGYLKSYGIFDVDFLSSNKTRTPKASAKYVSEVGLTLTP